MTTSKGKIKVKSVRDKDGRRGVFISSDDWKIIKKEFESLKKNIATNLKKGKPSAFKDIKEALNEVALIRQRKIKPKDINDFLREL